VKSVKIVWLSVAVLFITLPSSVLFSAIVNQEPLYTNGLVSDPDNSYTVGQYAADDFVIEVELAVSIDKITWWGGYVATGTAPASDSFYIRIFNSQIPSSSTLIYEINMNSVSREDTMKRFSTVVWNTPIYEYSSFLSGIYLSHGNYSISIVNDTSFIDSDDDWAWATSLMGNKTSYYASFYNGVKDPEDGPWSSYDKDLSFSFEVSVIPEPATVLLLGLGGLVIRRRR